MDNIKIGDKIGLSWIQGHGNAKVVGVYQDYVMVIHYCNNKPIVVHKSDIVLPEYNRSIEDEDDTILADKKKVIQWILEDVKLGGSIRQAIKNI